MHEIIIEHDHLIVNFSGIDRFLAMRRKVEVPLAYVQSVAQMDPMPRLMDKQKGTKFLGSRIYGKLFIGSNFQNGKNTFWCLRATQEAVSIRMLGHHFDEVNIAVDSASMTIDQIKTALEKVKANQP